MKDMASMLKVKAPVASLWFMHNMPLKPTRFRNAPAVGLALRYA